jgi:hypothetical protein
MVTSQNAIEQRSSRDARLVAPLMRRPSLLFIVVYTTFVCALDKFHSRFVSNVVERTTFVFFRLSLREYRRKLGDRSFKCLIFAVLVQYFMLIRSKSVLETFRKGTLSSFIKSDPKACSCFIRLQSFSLRSALTPFLFELMYTRDREEALKLALWFYHKIVLKKPQMEENTFVNGKFAVVLIGRQHFETKRLYRTLMFVVHTINNNNVKRIHVLARGDAITHARIFEGILRSSLNIKKKFEKTSAIVGDTKPMVGLSITFEVQSS